MAEDRRANATRELCHHAEVEAEKKGEARVDRVEVGQTEDGGGQEDPSVGTEPGDQAPLQEAMAYAINLPDEYYTKFLKDYIRRKEMLCGALKDLGFDVYDPQGAYYVNVNIGALGFEDDFSFCTMLTKEAGVAAIPCSVFWKDRRGGRDLARFCFCKKEETLEEGIRRLKAWRGRS